MEPSTRVNTLAVAIVRPSRSPSVLILLPVFLCNILKGAHQTDNMIVFIQRRFACNNITYLTLADVMAELSIRRSPGENFYFIITKLINLDILSEIFIRLSQNVLYRRKTVIIQKGAICSDKTASRKSRHSSY